MKWYSLCLSNFRLPLKKTNFRLPICEGVKMKWQHEKCPVSDLKVASTRRMLLLEPKKGNELAGRCPSAGGHEYKPTQRVGVIVERGFSTLYRTFHVCIHHISYYYMGPLNIIYIITYIHTLFSTH